MNFFRALGSILSISGGGGGGGRLGKSRIDPTVVPLLMLAIFGTIVLGGLRKLKIRYFWSILDITESESLLGYKEKPFPATTPNSKPKLTVLVRFQ